MSASNTDTPDVRASNPVTDEIIERTTDGATISFWNTDAKALQAKGDILEAVLPKLLPVKMVRRKTVKDAAGSWGCVIAFRAMQAAHTAPSDDVGAIRLVRSGIEHAESAGDIHANIPVWALKELLDHPALDGHDHNPDGFVHATPEQSTAIRAALAAQPRDARISELVEAGKKLIEWWPEGSEDNERWATIYGSGFGDDVRKFRAILATHEGGE